MKFKIKFMDISTGGLLVVILNHEDAKELDMHPLDRVCLKRKNNKTETAIVDVTYNKKSIPRGTIGLMHEVVKSLKVKEGEMICLSPTSKPLSLDHIKKKLDGEPLKKKEIDQIVQDIVENKLSEIEMTYFVAACYSRSISEKETVYLTKAMASHGEIFKIDRYPIMDKHCVGGVAGNRTTMLIVPIIAAAGLTIPKTSSRSITSPAGTADTMECLTNVSLDLNEMKKVVTKTNGCIVWGGALNLAPADDKIIRVEKPLGIDAKSQLLASILAKKLSVSSTHLLIDIPVGKGAKIETMRYANTLRDSFISVSKKVGIKAQVIITDGSKPVGRGIGPILESRDVVWVLKNDYRAPRDLKEKVLVMAGMMLEMGKKAKKGEGKKLAAHILKSGKAYYKFTEIMNAQGRKDVEISNLLMAEKSYEVMSRKNGTIVHIDNRCISKIARIAGAPQDEKAGIYLHVKVGQKIKKGDLLFTIYAHNKDKLMFAIDTWERIGGIFFK